jgi:hypothetical protein
MVIDPVEAVIVWLTGALTSVEGRVAGKHRYGEGWAEGATGLSVHPDGGLPDLYATVARPRFEMRVYADDPVKVVRAWREMVALSRANRRFTVNTSLGTALIHYCLPETALSLLYDDVLKMDLGIVFFEAMVSEEAVSF